MMTELLWPGIALVGLAVVAWSARMAFTHSLRDSASQARLRALEQERKELHAEIVEVSRQTHAAHGYLDKVFQMLEDHGVKR